MSSIRLRWRQQGFFEGFDVYRDIKPINPIDLPEPLVAGLTVMSYEDFDIDLNVSYYYRVMVRRLGSEAVSQQIIVETMETEFPKDIELLFDENLLDSISGTEWAPAKFAPITYSEEIKGYKSGASAYFSEQTYAYAVAPALNFGNGDFTLNIDAYRTKMDDSYQSIIGGGIHNSSTDRLQGLKYRDYNRVMFDLFNESDDISPVSPTNSVVMRAWNNFKVIRHNDIIFLLVNDVWVSGKDAPNEPINLNKAGGAVFGAVWYNANRSIISAKAYHGYLDNFYATSTRSMFPKGDIPPRTYLDFNNAYQDLGTAKGTVNGTNLYITTFLNRPAIIVDASNKYMNVIKGMSMTSTFRMEIDFHKVPVNLVPADFFFTSSLNDYNIRVGIDAEYYLTFNDIRTFIVPDGFNSLIIQGKGDKTEITLNGKSMLVDGVKPFMMTSHRVGVKDSNLNYETTTVSHVFKLVVYSYWLDNQINTHVPQVVMDVPLVSSRESYLVKDFTNRHIWNPINFGTQKTTVHQGVECLEFNGVDQYLKSIDTNHALDLSGGPAIISFDIFIDESVATSGIGYPIINGRAPSGGNGIWIFSNGGEVKAAYQTGNQNHITTVTIPTNTWVNVKYRWDIQGDLYIEINNTVSKKHLLIPLFNLSISAQIGQAAGHSGSFKGYLANIKVVKGSDDVTLLLDDNTTYENRVLTYKPVAYWPMVNATSSEPVTDLSGNNLHGTVSGLVTYTNPPLRHNHPGAMGFAVANPAVAKVSAPLRGKLLNLTKQSFSWCVWVNPTNYSTYNYIFADWINSLAGTVNMRANVSLFEFPANGSRLSFDKLPLNTITFLAIVYDTVKQTYRACINGQWIDGIYNAPPTSTNDAPFLEFPAYGNWDYYGMRGYMSDLAFFDSALSTAAIEGIYKAGQFPPLPKPSVTGEFEYVTETDSFIHIYWNSEIEFESYSVARSTEEFGTYEEIATNLTTTEYKDTNSIIASRTYYYQVTGYLNNRSAVSNSYTVPTYSRHILNFSELMDSTNTTLNFKRRI